MLCPLQLSFLLNSSFSFPGENGHYYCYLRVLSCSCCDGICGSQSRCNCAPCQKLDEEEGQIVTTETSIPAEYTIESWLWGPQPC
jgi:E3 ubiquitin-protein ligase HERC2